jgi:hypothetical protein
MQSASLAQFARQPSPAVLHLTVPFEQLVVVPLAHDPLPLHACGVTVAGALPLPTVHTDGHSVDAPGYVQANVLTPLHEPTHIGLFTFELHAGRGVTGAPVTGTQLPRLPGTLHAWH